MANTKKSSEEKTTKKKNTTNSSKNISKEVVENEKRNKTIIIIVLLVGFFIGIFYLSTLSEKGRYSEPKVDDSTQLGDGVNVEEQSKNISDDEKKDLASLDINKYLELKKSDEKNSIIYIGRPTCPHCVIQKPIMEHLVYKYGVEINYLNTDELDESEMKKLVSSDKFFTKEEGWGTPLTMIVKGDEILDYIEGSASIEKMVELFKKYDLIAEGE